MPESVLIEGYGPLAVHRPTRIDDAAALVRDHADQAIYPYASGLYQHIGLPPQRAGIAIDTTGLTAVDDYPARDMTVTLQVGTTVQALQDLLAKENQYLPVDVPQPGRTTIGSALAVNLSGSRRWSHGTLRDYLIGIRLIADDGADVKGGGRVVKNVAGYDLMKLHIGALGTLGVITQATLKVKPRPEAEALVAFGVSAVALGPTLDRLHGSAARPATIEVVNKATAARLFSALGLSGPASEPWVVLCGFEEKKSTVQWQISALTAELKSAPVRDLSAYEGNRLSQACQVLADLQLGDQQLSTLKANLPASALAAFLNAASAAHPDLLIQSQAGNGIAFIHVPNESDPTRLSRLLQELTPLVREANANIVIQRCPTAWKSVLPVWGRATADRMVMKSIKAALDPQDRMNPRGHFPAA